MENVVGEADWFVRVATGEEAPDRLMRRENALPDTLGDLVGDCAT